RGINPEMVKDAATKFGKKIKIPDNFYSLVVERHENKEKINDILDEIKLDLSNVLETKFLYYYDYTETSNNAKVLKLVGNNVVLDQSVAYPTSGGQLHDIGTINGQKFNSVLKQGNYIIHILSEKPKFKEGEMVKVEVDKKWRLQLSQHHTATHIVNAAARFILGSHINQAGAKKTMKHSNLDITHYEQISREDLLKIEKKANEIVDKAIDMKLFFIPRSEAEQKYGMAIYQGGAVPGKNIRIVEIPCVDVEACGGTHLNNTSETGRIKIIKSQKIQDGVVRLTFTAGSATKELEAEESLSLTKLQSLLEIPQNKIVGRVEELLNKWKNLNKALQTGKLDESDMVLNSNNIIEVEILTELSRILNTKKEDIFSKVKKLYDEWNGAKAKLKEVENLLDEKFIETLIKSAFSLNGSKMILKSFENLTPNDLKNLSVKIIRKSEDLNTIFINKDEKGITIIGMVGKGLLKSSDFNMGNFVKNIASKYNGKGGGKVDFGQVFIGDKEVKVGDLVIYIKEKLIKS
ncbi:MAG: alanine--tRNA ligase-related protein, partial [Promethearchaeota archaeon]